MIDFTALQYALSVRDSGSFRKAAATLGVRASVVSRKVRALEEAIGVGLFQRRSQGIILTIAGGRILAQASTIMADVETLIKTATLSWTLAILGRVWW